jgi:hypothetical protein
MDRFSVIFYINTLLLLVCFSPCLHGANKPLCVHDSTCIEYRKLSFRQASLAHEFSSLEKKLDILNKEREVWGTTLDRSNTLFVVINTGLLFAVGLIHFGFIRGIIKRLESKTRQQLEEFKEKFLDNESLLFRNLYFNSISLQQLDSALLWSSRVILKETERKNSSNVRFDIIGNMIRNMKDIAVELKEKGITLSSDTKIETLSNIRSYLMNKEHPINNNDRVILNSTIELLIH